jgi:hypothetical protein
MVLCIRGTVIPYIVIFEIPINVTNFKNLRRRLLPDSESLSKDLPWCPPSAARILFCLRVLDCSIVLNSVDNLTHWWREITRDSGLLDRNVSVVDCFAVCDKLSLIACLADKSIYVPIELIDGSVLWPSWFGTLAGRTATVLHVSPVVCVRRHSVRLRGENCLTKRTWSFKYMTPARNSRISELRRRIDWLKSNAFNCSCTF